MLVYGLSTTSLHLRQYIKPIITEYGSHFDKAIQTANFQVLTAKRLKIKRAFWDDLLQSFETSVNCLRINALHIQENFNILVQTDVLQR